MYKKTKDSLDHVMNKNEVLKLIIEGKIKDKKGMGRKKHSWLKNITGWTGCSLPVSECLGS